jgi:hypothetical protein
MATTSSSDASLVPGVDAEINALRREAIALVKTKIPEDRNHDKRIIDSAARGDYGSPVDALLNLVANLSKHDGFLILFTYSDAVKLGLPQTLLVNDDHIAVSKALDEHYRLLLRNNEILAHDHASEDEHSSVKRYALTNIADGYLIVNMYVERGMRTLQEIIGFLPVLKTSGHRALTEGVL